MLEELKPVADRLRSADRSWQQERGWCFLLRTVKFALLLVLAGFLLDVFLHLEPAGRFALALVFALAVLSVLGVTAWIGWIRRNQLERIARRLESRHPELGSKLINILQLEKETADPELPPLTRQMARLAIAGYSEELKQTDLQQLAHSPELGVAFKRALVAAVVFLAVLAGFYRISLIEIARFADPYGDHPPYSFTQLEITEPGPAGAEVTYGKSLLVKVKHSGHRPGDVYLTYYPPGQPQKAVTVPMFNKGELGFQQQIEDVRSGLVVFAHTRNQHSYSKKRQIGVLLTPKLEKAFVQVNLPAYTGVKSAEGAYDFKEIRALNGSAVQFRLRSNRPLRDGYIDATSATGTQRIPMTWSSTNEVAGTIPARDPLRLQFHLTDVDGIASHDTWEGSLAITHDLPPEVQIVNPAKDSFVSLDFKIDVQIDATDDYGLKQIRFHRALNRVYTPPKTVAYDTITRAARETFTFDFRELGVQPGDVVSFFAEAIDTAPEANVARSQTINLMVISVDEYNDFLREQSDITDIEAKYSELLSQFQDIVEEQKKLGTEIEELKQKLAKADARQKPALQTELDRLLARQSEVNGKLAQMAQRMEHFVRDEPVYDLERELQEILQQKASEIRDSAAANDAAAKGVAQKSSPPQGERQLTTPMLNDFKQASDEQVRRLTGAGQDAGEQIVNTLQDLEKMQELLKDFSQFEELYRAQKALAEQAQAYDRTTPLGREDQLALKNLGDTERRIAEGLDDLEQRLRKDARAAEELFPKAAKSARDLADKMQSERFSPMARQSTGSMLAGKGDTSFQLADRLRAEMEKLFSECQAQEGSQCREMDSYLKLQRNMEAGNTFKQMMQSRKAGRGKGNGFMAGNGTGQAGESGYAAGAQPTMDVLGNESRVSSSAQSSRQQGPPGSGAGTPGGGAPQLSYDKADVRKGLNPVNRESGAVTSGSLIEEYSDVVDKYFKAITK